MFVSRLRKLSLSVQYALFTALISLMILLGLIVISYFTYVNYQKLYSSELVRQGQKLQMVFDEKVAFIEHFLQFIGARISNHDAHDVKSIAKILKYSRSSDNDKMLSWNIVDFVTPDGILVADSKEGLRPHISLSGKRDWLDHTRDNDLKIHFSRPSVGAITKDYVLPVGLGIYTQDHKKFIGSVATGISIEKLLSSLIQLMKEEFVFILFDDEMRFITASDPFISEESVTKMLKHRVRDAAIGSNSQQTQAIESTAYLQYKTYVFPYLVHSQRFPFWFLIGFDTNIYNKNLLSDLLPKLAVSLLLGAVFAAILILLSYQVVKPIIILGRAAVNISKGKRVEVQSFQAHELNILSKQLNNIGHIYSSLRYKQTKLLKMNAELTTANEFIKGNMSFLSHELINPTGSIVEFSKMLEAKLKNEQDPDVISYLTMIRKASVHLNKQLDFFLRLFKFQASKKMLVEKRINIKEMLDWNVSMVMHHIKSRNVNISVVADSSLYLKADEIMIGQLIQNIASNGAKYNKYSGNLSIIADITKKGELRIKFADTGIGIDKKELKGIFKLFERARNTKDTKVIGYGIGLAYAKQCIDAHNARIKVESELGQGTIFTVTFPKDRTIIA